MAAVTPEKRHHVIGTNYTLTSGFPRDQSGKESACLCRRNWFYSWAEKIHGLEDPGGPQSVGLQRVGQD